MAEKLIHLRPAETDAEAAAGLYLAIGCVYKEQPFKPSILDEFAGDRASEPPVPRANYSGPEDALVLEDESGRVALAAGSRGPGAHARLVAQLVSGVVLGVRGRVLPSGELAVEDVAVAGLALAPAPGAGGGGGGARAARTAHPLARAMRPRAEGEPPVYALLVSGLAAGGAGGGEGGLGGSAAHAAALQLLTEFVSGAVGGGAAGGGAARGAGGGAGAAEGAAEGDAAGVSCIARIIVAGGTVGYAGAGAAAAGSGAGVGVRSAFIDRTGAAAAEAEGGGGRRRGAGGGGWGGAGAAARGAARGGARGRRGCAGRRTGLAATCACATHGLGVRRVASRTLVCASLSVLVRASLAVLVRASSAAVLVRASLAFLVRARHSQPARARHLRAVVCRLSPMRPVARATHAPCSARVALARP